MCIGLHKRQRISKEHSRETGKTKKNKPKTQHNMCWTPRMQTNNLLFRNTIYFLQNNIFYEDDAFYINAREHRMGNKKDGQSRETGNIWVH